MNTSFVPTDASAALNAFLWDQGWQRHPESLHWMAPKSEVSSLKKIHETINAMYAQGLIVQCSSALVSRGSAAVGKAFLHSGPYDGPNQASYCLCYTFILP